MKKAPRLIQAAVLLILLVLSGSAYADEPAPKGAAGTLTINITVKGKGSLESGKIDYDSIQWKAANTLSYSARIVAQDPLTQPDDADVEDMSGSGLSPEDEAVQEKWDKKMDDCAGDEDCENAVLAEMMADPGYQKMMADMQNAAPDMMKVLGQVNLGSNVQLWLPPTGKKEPTFGSCKVDREDRIYGIIEPTGGKSNSHSRTKGEMAIGNGPDQMNFFPTMTIDKQAKTYKVEIDANFNIRATADMEADGESVEHNEPCTMSFIGSTPEAGGWKSALTLAGSVDSASHPNFEGKRTLKSDFGNPDDPHHTFPATVTIEWKFESDK